MTFQRSLIPLVALASIAATGSSLHAASVTFTGSGNTKWNIPSNWSTGTVPVAGDDVTLFQNGAQNITIDLNTVYGAPGLASLLIDAEGSGNIFVNSAKTFNVSGIETIGDFGKGAFNQNKGTHTTGGIQLGVSGTSSLGTYTIKKGTLNVDGDLLAGIAGQGVFTHRGGTVNVGGALSIGGLDTSAGSYTMTKGTLRATGGAIVGDLGIGFFTQSRGTSNMSDLVVGFDSTAAGTVNFNGGRMNSNSVTVGDLGLGNFNHSNGTHSITGDLTLGLTVGDGTYTISRGTLNVGGKLVVGVGGVGTFVHTNGRVTASDGVTINSGGYELENGSLNTSSLLVGAGGSFSASGTNASIRTSGDVTFDAAASISTTAARLTIAKNSDINLTVLGADIGKDFGGFGDSYSFDKITLERNVTLSLDGTTGLNALYVDKLDIGTNSVFRIDSIIIGNGINVYYNADAEENRYLGGGSYALGNGGRLIPISLEGDDSSTSGSTFGFEIYGSGSLTLGGTGSFGGAGVVTTGTVTLGPGMSPGGLVFEDVQYASGTLSESQFAPPGVVPEPTTGGLVVMGILAFLARRRAASRG